ncbi:hypothetical protein SRABI27_01608 [Pedobacter sp. Bi27]|nr:hypothetical protein SRABI36_01270 [Pedobacter sp. Bi36]CAH0195343.1 hypothetical protein SRABI27_01608 [Pedobacter sp. Bi27]CAH0227098.1 hypothetical protein SRABI126_02363 [Pedobacter sp. Bi126]
MYKEYYPYRVYVLELSKNYFYAVTSLNHLILGMAGRFH